VGSAIDREAQLRATSVYFPDRVVPMLPERLSNEICSLKPGVDRLVQSVEVEIDRKGNTVNFELYDGVIHSAARMTYKQVAALLEGTDEQLAKEYAGHIEHFQLMSELCDVLRAYRMKRGSIDFDLPEPDMRINMLGEVEDIFRTERNQAHRLIEEFMIRTNEVVASHMEWEEVPSPFRVHEGPNAEKVEQFREFIGGLGIGLGGGKDPSPADFQKLVEHLQGQPGERTLIYLMLRTMKQARYQVDNIGHFGLASPRYTHYTSPIRRYPDLIVHRLLKADLERPTQTPFELAAYQGHLHALCTESSERERNAEGAERRYVDWKTVQFMADKQGDSFEAFITGVHAYGFFVELEQLFVEGLVHVSSLTDDYYQYDERKHTLRGDSKGRTLTLGNRVKVQLVRVDKERRRLDFHLEEGPLESNIKPLEKAAVEEQAEDTGRRRRRRRRGRGRGDADKAAAAPQQDTGRSGRGDKQEAGMSGRDDQQDAGARKGRDVRRGRDAREAEDRGEAPADKRGARRDGKQDAKEGTKKDARQARDAKGDEKESGTRRRRGGRRRGGRGKGGEAKEATGKEAKAKEAEAKGAKGKEAKGKEAKADERGDGKPRRQRRSRKPDDDSGRGRRARSGRSSSARPARRANGDGEGDTQRSSTAAKPATQPAAPDKVEAPKDKPRGKVNPYLTDL
jgi:predicted RNA-binding protein with RPS1 domain